MGILTAWDRTVLKAQEDVRKLKAMDADVRVTADTDQAERRIALLHAIGTMPAKRGRASCAPVPRVILTMSEPTPAEPSRRRANYSRMENEDVLSPSKTNESVTALWVICAILALAAIVLYYAAFNVGINDDAASLLRSSRLLEVANTAMTGALIAVVGGLVVTGLRWRRPQSR